MALKLFLLSFLIISTHSYSFRAPASQKSECTEENYRNLGINPEKVRDCKDVTVNWRNLGGDRFWLVINYFYNVHYYDFEFSYDREVVESIVDKEFDVRHLVGQKKKILFLTNNNCEDFKEYRHLHSTHDFETKTSLLITKNFTINGIIFNKYHIRNVDATKHIVIEFKNSTEIYEEIYYNNLLGSQSLKKTKNEKTVSLNINVDYSENEKSLKTEVRVMIILMYWNAVAMLLSGAKDSFSIKIKKINFAENAGVMFPANGYTVFKIHKSMKKYFQKIKVSKEETVDIQVAMTKSQICLRAADNGCDMEGYTFVLSTEYSNTEYSIAVVGYTPDLFNYHLGAREIAHSMGINYQISDGIMSRKKSSKLTWTTESLFEFMTIKKSAKNSRRNSKEKNSHIPLHFE